MEDRLLADAATSPARSPVHDRSTPPIRRPRTLSYKPLRDYGLIGDMRTAALVGRDGSIDWCCFPRFDSSSVFARLLDDRDGGHWSVSPRATVDATQSYEEGTNVLATRFEAEDGVLRVTDFMPVLEWNRQLASHHEIHRRLEVPEGEVDVEVVFRPRFDYARRRPRFRHRAHGVLASDGEDEVLTVSGLPGVRWDLDEGDGEARARFRLSRGQSQTLVLRWDDDEVWPPEEYRSDRKLDSTRRFWEDWSAGIQYRGAYGGLVRRSALALKLLFYAPTGAVVAAPTTSLPERLGGDRNWDYRFSWLRDATYTLFALYALGKFEELDRYMVYLKKVCRMEADHMQIMFGVGGEQDLAERELEHLEGYRGSRPVRVGNEAAGQFQLDIYGEVLDSIHIWRKKHRMTEGMWELCRRLARHVCERWREPDHGVWELRGPKRHFVFSKVMAWVALDRAVRIADDLGLDGDVDRWREEREAIFRDVLENGWDEERGAFVQHYGTDRMDASNLALPLVRFLPADDPRIRSTVERIRQELGHPSGLLHRHALAEEGAFWVSSFQLAQALALDGRREEAVEVFEETCRHAGPLGLFSEEVDPDSGEMLGNFPQAFTHIGLINAAHVIARVRRADEPAKEMMLEE